MPSVTPFEAWVTHHKPNPRAQLRLFCFPFAGGGASVFRAWPAEVIPQIEVCPVQLPGRENRLLDPSFTRVSAVVEALAPILLPYLDLPFAFFGHSLGGLISFELARLLRREYGKAPAHLFVAGCAAPQIADPHPPIYNLPDPEFVAELRRLDGTPEGVLQQPELLQLLLPCLRADFEMGSTYGYVADEPLACPISVFGGLSDPEISRADLEGWREHTQAKFVVRMLPGEHFFLLTTRAQILQMIALDLRWIINAPARAL
ncbi:MAG: thioesterase [Chloroflexi bacterium]|nr:thioesterase [Chloroflexota bacterium]